MIELSLCNYPTVKKSLIAGLAVLSGMAMPCYSYEQGDMLVRAGISSFDYDNNVIDDDKQLGVDFVYILTGISGVGQVAIETSTTLPVNLDDKQGNKLADFVPLTVVAQYYFDTGVPVTFYVGAGLNYSVMNGPAEVDNSMGVVLQAGADFVVNDEWSVNGNIRQIEMDLSGSDASGSFQSFIDPLVVSINAVFRF